MGPIDDPHGRCKLSPVTCHCGREHFLSLHPDELRRRTELLMVAENSTEAMHATLGRPDWTLREIRKRRRAQQDEIAARYQAHP